MNKVVILGAKGMVGMQLSKLLPEAIAFDKDTLDVTNEEALRAKLMEIKPEVIINCVAYNNVDGAEANREQAFLLNFDVVKSLYKIANEINAILVHFSTGYVFDGQASSYNENATTFALSAYAESKAAGEAAAQQAKKYYLIRTNAIFGPAGDSEHSKKSFVDIMLSLAQKMPSLKVVNDEINSITYAPDLAKSVVELIKAKPPFGIYHLVNEGFATWYEFAKEIFSIKNINIEVTPVPGSEFPRPAKRPARAVINNTKLPKLRTWQEALKEYLK